jgi:formate hydrogenlyase transcriptional activator
VPAAALSRLRAYHWPGNVREFQNVIERAMLLSGDVLVLPQHFEQDAEVAPRKAETFREASRRCIRSALQKSEGRVYGPRGAARALGLQPSTLQSKMLRLGITRR